MNNKFINLEDEIMLRQSIRNIYKNGGIIEVYQAMGEIAASLEIISELAQELLADEEKNKKGGN